MASEEDLRVARESLKPYLHTISGVLDDAVTNVATAITTARAEQREVDARKCHVIADKYKPRRVGPNAVAQNVASEESVAIECAAAIRAGKDAK